MKSQPLTGNTYGVKSFRSSVDHVIPFCKGSILVDRSHSQRQTWINFKVGRFLMTARKYYKQSFLKMRLSNFFLGEAKVILSEGSEKHNLLPENFDLGKHICV